MNKVEFTYIDDKFLIQCNNDDKMKDIIFKFLNKADKNKGNLYFLYNGQIINEELVFNKCANSLDRSRNYMNVLVIEGQSSSDEMQNLIKSNYIICPKCNENSIISIDNFKISISGCKEGHKTENLQLDELGKTQYINQSQIKCDKCRSLKSESIDYQFFNCFKCNQNLCPRCKDSHEQSHKSNIKKYDEKQFYCKIHFDSYICYCNDCKINICSLCKNQHEGHKLITFDSIVPDIDHIRNNELKDTKEKIYELKLIVNNMIYQLNNLNKNLDTYFEVYNNIISNFDINKKNYSLIQNVNNMKKFNDNFLGAITEIIKDNNLKNQFTNIISLQSNIDFKKMKKKSEIAKKIENENRSDKNVIIEDKIKDTDIFRDDAQNYNPLNDKYENFNINKIKEIKSYITKNEITNMLILKDRRILTLQQYYDENGDSFTKLCVYSIKNGFICDINIDFENVNEIILIEDGNVIINSNQLKIVKFHKNSVEEIWNFEGKVADIKRLLKNNFFIMVKESTKENKNNKNNFFSAITGKYKRKRELFNYDKGKLLFSKNLDQLYINEERIENICQINDIEYVLYTNQKGKIYGTNDNLIFYDMQSNKKIKTLKVGKGENSYEMFLFNNEKLIIGGDNSIKLIDIKIKKFIKEFKFDIYLDDVIYLNEKSFLYRYSIKLYQYEFKDSNTIEEKEKIDFRNEILLKYPEAKLIAYYDKKITIYG